MPITAVLGEQRGDEGKGRYVDMLAEDHDIVARFNGGNNAGHTVVLPDERVLKLNLLPSGIAHDHTTNVIGNGAYVNPIHLVSEIDKVTKQNIVVNPDRLLISSLAQLIMPHHISADEIREAGKNEQGSTKRGIAPCASEKYFRSGLQVGMLVSNLDNVLDNVSEKLIAQREEREVAGLDPVDEDTAIAEYYVAGKKLGEFVTDTVLYLNRELTKPNPARVLAEGAQAFWLDIDHGMYPYTTSSSTTIGGVITGLGVGPGFIEKTIGVAKVIQSHVGGGPYVTEITDSDLLTTLHGDKTAIDAEKGTTTQRERRLGYLDIPMLRRAQMVNQTSEIYLTKLDWLDRFVDELPICVGYRRDGEYLRVAPSSADEMQKCEPVYTNLEPWQEDISGARSFEDLPKQAKEFVKLVESQTNLPVTKIGVGPGREQVIDR